MNPYKILGVSRNASKPEIIAAAAKALKTRQFSGFEVSQAQKKLMSPASKALHDFLYFIDLEYNPAQLKSISLPDSDDNTLVLLDFPETNP